MQEFQQFCEGYKAFRSIIFKCFIVVALSQPAFADDSIFQKAMEAKSEKNFLKSEELLKKAVSKDSENAEYWFQLGLVQRYNNKNNDALASQRKALSLSKTNDDVKLEIARLEIARQNNAKAEAILEGIVKRNPDYLDAQNLLASVKANQNISEIEDIRPLKWQIDFGHELSAFYRSNNAHWRQNFIQVGRWLNNSTILHVRAENTERFKTHDEHYELGLAHIFNKQFVINGSVGRTKDSVFIPKWRLKAGTEYHVEPINSWLTLNVQNDRYENLTTTVYKPGIRYEITEALNMHAQHIDVIDENKKLQRGWSARINWLQPLDDINIFVGMSDAPETENATVIDTRSHFGGLSYQLNDNATLHTSYARESRENSFLRHVFSTALSLKF